ncbi:nitrite reductase small subunit NirD [Agromyces sp. SYSU T00194]|uniref:nitrite reductase small subunit NirD n=1 Tax=Agromyces chitinivorans TaxID=3158560 RepID=UPI0033928FAE
MTIIDSASTAAPSRPAAPTAWTPVCRRVDLTPLWGEAALVHGRQVALFLLPDGRLFAVSNQDPATGSHVISRGIVGSRGGRPTIASPLHKDVFDLATGECLTNPDLRLPTWRVHEDAEHVISVAPARALVAASHGTSDAAGQRAVAALVDAVRDARPELVIADAFVDVQEPDVPAVVEAVHDDLDVTIVPLLLSAGYHVYHDLADVAEEVAGAAGAPDVAVAAALGPDPRLADVLARRLEEAGLADDDRVVLAAAGSSDARAVDDCHAVGALLAARLEREVTVSFISAADPRVADAVSSVRASAPARVVVASYLLAPGYFATLAAEAGGDLTSAPLLADGDAPPAELVAIVAERFDATSPA